MLSFLTHQPADVAVGRLDHGVEVIGGPAVDFSPVDPGEQDRRGLAELMVICGEKVPKSKIQTRENVYLHCVAGQQAETPGGHRS